MKRKKPKNNRAVGYIRVSDIKQVEEGMSLEYQEEKIRNYCNIRDLELVEIVIDGARSAYHKELDRRPGGQKLIALVDSGQVGTVVAVRLDRLFRSQRRCIDFVEDWDQQGVALHLLDLGGSAINLATPIGQLVVFAMATVARMESDTKSKRMCEVWAHVRKQGRILGKNAPFGYSVGAGNTLIENQEEQDTISLIKSWKGQGQSYRQIVSGLERMNRRPRGSKWNITTLVRILKRESNI